MVFLLADVELAAQDRLDSRFFGGIDEMHGAEDIAVIGHGDRGHIEFLDALAKLSISQAPSSME